MTLPPAPLAAPPPPAHPPRAAHPARSGSLLRSGRAMAVGTIASRGSGLLRTVVLAAVLGTRGTGDAYAIANTLPNIVYELLLGGVLTSVVVPLLVRAQRMDSDQGTAYGQRLLTLVALTLGAASLIGVLVAPALTAIYTGSSEAGSRALAVEFARYFLPQIAFYGIGATMGAILNTRGSFAAPMWTPVLNNVVVLGTGAAVALMPGGGTSPHGPLLSHAQIVVLALGTTVGVVVQTVALVPALRRTGFRWQPRFDFRNAGLRQAAALGGWVVLYVVANQLGYAVVVRLAHKALTTAGGTGSGSYTTYVYAFVVFSLPHAVVAVSVITALLPRMSRHVVDGRTGRLVRDLGAGFRVASVVLVPATFALVVLAQPLVEVLLRHGQVAGGDARVLGWTLAAFAVGLVPFSAFQLHLRVFYALGDTRSPAYIGVVVNAVNVLADLLLYVTLHGSARLPGLAAGYAVSYAVGVALTSGVLRRRLGTLDGPRTVRTLVRLVVASLPGAVLAWLISRLIGATLGHGFGASLLTLLLATGAGGILLLVTAKRLHIRETSAVLAAVAGRTG